MNMYSWPQEIKILKGKNKGKVATFRDYIDDEFLLYSLGGSHRAKIKIENTEPYVRKYKGVPVTELCSVCWVGD